MNLILEKHRPFQYFLAFARRFIGGSLLGLRNFTPTGIRAAGLKRSVGFVLQPVENWSRYPEFYAVEKSLPATSAQDVILDLGSPKMFGLLLAKRKQGQHRLTDIWPPAIFEFKNIAELVKRNSNHSIEMFEADATSLRAIADSSVTLLYSISVLEHIPSASKLHGIGSALQEIERVLTPGGTAVVSVPVARIGRIEYKNEAVYAAGHDGTPVFFQNIFGQDEILQALAQANNLSLASSTLIEWKLQWLPLKLWRKVPQKIRGALGIVNLIIAPWTFELVPQQTTPLKIQTDGDLILVFNKK